MLPNFVARFLFYNVVFINENENKSDEKCKYFELVNGTETETKINKIIRTKRNWRKII